MEVITVKELREKLARLEDGKEIVFLERDSKCCGNGGVFAFSHIVDCRNDNAVLLVLNRMKSDGS